MIRNMRAETLAAGPTFRPYNEMRSRGYFAWKTVRGFQRSSGCRRYVRYNCSGRNRNSFNLRHFGNWFGAVRRGRPRTGGARFAPAPRASRIGAKQYANDRENDSLVEPISSLSHSNLWPCRVITGAA
jgi:hypothetical protein